MVVIGVNRSGGESVIEFEGNYSEAEKQTYDYPGCDASFEICGAALIRGARRREIDVDILLDKRPVLRELVEELAIQRSAEDAIDRAEGLAEARAEAAREARWTEGR